MKTFNTENQFTTVAVTFCLIGLALLLSVMIWHQQINQHPLFKKGAAAAVAADLQVAALPVATPAADLNSTRIPDSVLQEITADPRNLSGYQPPAAELSPALKFLYTLEQPDIFPTQQ
ncbi:hypothetical protein A2994_00295 [candidate division Kazan bacterium RIFCSPLOWO2_01_FULL_48_13]|uniref:Uncharacterized protein n=1 Tax=candidate division Kazan bacterium RIFCSPLOWO2_01_FULL_48_13 TaxID=1798539 RepID=A0A1F4PPR4_UNCK3|nr:MAG: hypothetical protein A2994_00295 [candidate division Kazan bacterium RIFCSPLOWO2_01_FULL_48_13]